MVLSSVHRSPVKQRASSRRPWRKSLFEVEPVFKAFRPTSSMNPPFSKTSAVIPFAILREGSAYLTRLWSPARTDATRSTVARPRTKSDSSVRLSRVVYESEERRWRAPISHRSHPFRVCNAAREGGVHFLCLSYSGASKASETTSSRRLETLS